MITTSAPVPSMASIPPRSFPARLKAKHSILSGSAAILVAAFGAAAPMAEAATLVTETAVVLNFATTPGDNDWSTVSSAGAGGDITTPAQLDARVATLTAAGINTALPASATNPPSTNALARHNTALQLLQTRPTGNAATLLMATLQNGVGRTVETLRLEYDLGVFNPVAESPGLEGHRVYFSLDGTAWTNIPEFNNVGTAGRLTADVPVTTWQSNSQLFLLWADDNGPGTDSAFTLDNVSFRAIATTIIGRNLTYNLNHPEPGAPNGILSTGPGRYFLEGATPTAFQATDVANFSQDGFATIDVPADILTGGVVVSHSVGDYTIGGVGKISGPFTKSNSGSVLFTSANSFTGSMITGGTVETQAGALGSGTVAISEGAQWNITTTAQVQAGALDVGVNGAIIQTDADLSVTRLDGIGLLTKSGNAALNLTGGAGTANGGLLIIAGKVATATTAALGGANQSISLDGTTLEFTHATGDQVFSDAATPRFLQVTGNGGTISVTNGPGSVGVVINVPDTFTGGGTITKIGAGALRMRANQTGLTSNWVINNGTLEYGVGTTSGIGSGFVLVNAGGRFAGQNTPVPGVAVALMGGELGTRSGDLTDFQGPITVNANSAVNLVSFTTPAASQTITISGVLSGIGDLSIIGNNPQPVIGKALILTNIANSFEGTFRVAAAQTLSSEAAGGTGSTLNARPIVLSGGVAPAAANPAILRIRDNGLGDNGVLTYGNNITADGPATIEVDRPATGLSAGNTVDFGTLSLNSMLNVIGANGYSVRVGATTLTGDATFNTTTANFTINDTISGAFGITKSGAANLILPAINTYTGRTNIDAGTLVLTGAIDSSPRIDLKTGAFFDVSNVAGGYVLNGTQTLSGVGSVIGPVTVANNGAIEAGDLLGAGDLSFSALTFGAVPGNRATVTLTRSAIPSTISVSTPDGLIALGGAMNITINITGSAPTLGQSVLIDYVGGIGGTGFDGFRLGTIATPRVIANLVNNVANSSIDLNVTGTDFPVWTGALSSEWSTAVLANPKNWKLNSNGAPTDFLTNDSVLFTDGATRTTVDVSVVDVAVAALNFANAASDYTITGSRAITGNVPLVKDGAGRVTISNVNSFTGPAILNAGTVRVAEIANAGANSALGAGSTIAFNGGALEFTGAAGVTNRALTLDLNGGTVRTDTSLTLTGIVSGAGRLTKGGTGTLILTGANTYGETMIAGGTLQVGDGALAGTVGTGLVTNNGFLAFNNTAAVTFANTIQGNGGILKSGIGDLTIGGTEANTFTGVTTVTGGVLIAGKPADVVAIGGDLVLEAGGVFRYVGNNVSNQIADTASIIINGGTFGDPANAAPTNPGATDTVANLTVTAGTFGSGRHGTTLAPFTITGLLQVTGGTVLAQRGGAITANSVDISGGSVNLDGGSTTALNESRLTIGIGGLSLTNGTINFNTGPSALTATSSGSILALNGDVISTGTSVFARSASGLIVPKAEVDLAGADRIFDVSGTLTVGAAGAGMSLVNGGVTKVGPGTLILHGANGYSGETNIDAGTISVTGSISGSIRVDVDAGAVLDVGAVAGGFAVDAVQTLAGDGSVAGNVTINGTLAPGSITGSGIGSLDFTGSLTLAGTADFQIDKTGVSLTADLASVTAALTYGGTLNVAASGGSLANGDTFDLFDAPSFAGAFAAINLPSLNAGLSWSTDQLAINGRLVVVPEPGSAMLLLAGVGLLGLRRRRA